jgi:hypothetical protein
MVVGVQRRFFYSLIYSEQLKQIHCLADNREAKNQNHDHCLFFIECTGVILSDFHSDIYQKALLSLLYISDFTVIILFGTSDENLSAKIMPAMKIQNFINTNLTIFHSRILLMLRDSGLDFDSGFNLLETVKNLQIQSEQIVKDNLLSLVRTDINSPFLEPIFLYTYKQTQILTFNCILNLCYSLSTY